MSKKIVFKVEEGMDRQDILCTTYQMRNFYKQFRDGFFSHLDVMNYIQHYQAALWCGKNINVLDVCCGRGLMLPLLRYHAKDINSYTGVDIEPKNAIFLKERVTDGQAIDPNTYYPFKVNFVNSNVSEMSSKLKPNFYNIIIYTSAIEHMHRDDGQKSLIECRKVIKNNGLLFLTCPNTPESQNGYNTQYKAHVYEWKRSELIDGLRLAGFKIESEYGLTIDKKSLEELAKKMNFKKMLDKISKFIPSEFLLPVFAPLFPNESKEIGFICKPV